MKALRSSNRHRWAFLRRHDIADLLDIENIYMTRWRLIQTPWFGIYLHALRRPDGDRHLHNHPWRFASLILRGGYVEEHAQNAFDGFDFARLAEHWPDTCKHGVERAWRPGSFHRMDVREFHSIRQLGRAPCWTLVFVGRRRQEWGYATADGWVGHASYHHTANPEYPAPTEAQA